MDNVANDSAFFTQARDIHVWECHTRAIHRKTTDLIGDETRILNKFGCKRVTGRGE